MLAPNVLKQLSGKWKLELLFLMKDQPRRRLLRLIDKV